KQIKKKKTNFIQRIKQIKQDVFEAVPINIKHNQYLELHKIDMEDDDEDADDKMAEIKKLTNDYTPPANSCTTFKLLYASLQAFEINLHQYAHLENNILFPKALVLERQLQSSLSIDQSVYTEKN